MASAVDRLPERPGSLESGSPAIPWVPIGWFAVLTVLCYLPVLTRLGAQWFNDDDMGHGFFVPLIAAYIVWIRRDELLRAEIKPNYWGLALIAWGAFQLLLGTLGAELFLQRTAFIVTIAGCILLTCGTAVLKLVSFPVALLVFMVPLPRIIYTQITFPLQLFASRVAETVLNMIDIPALRDGNILELASGLKLSVVEACSGIRSLLSLTFLSLVYAFFFDKKPWMRWALLLLTIPIAIAANAGRVTVTGILSNYKPELAGGFSHTMEGWIIFVIDLLLLMAAHRFVNLIYNGIHAKSTPVTPAV
jgi:exosortase